MTTYSFGVYNEETVRAIASGELDSETASYDEIDVRASDRRQALCKARAEANDLYGAGSVLFPLPAGGSGGLVQGTSA